MGYFYSNDNHSGIDLNEIVKKKRIKKFFCFHSWIFYSNMNSSGHYCICKKCYKKELKFGFNGHWINNDD